jgi:hypothetical protein
VATVAVSRDGRWAAAAFATSEEAASGTTRASVLRVFHFPEGEGEREEGKEEEAWTVDVPLHGESEVTALSIEQVTAPAAGGEREEGGEEEEEEEGVSSVLLTLQSLLAGGWGGETTDSAGGERAARVLMARDGDNHAFRSLLVAPRAGGELAWRPEAAAGFESGLGRRATTVVLAPRPNQTALAVQLTAHRDPAHATFRAALYRSPPPPAVGEGGRVGAGG